MTERQRDVITLHTECLNFNICAEQSCAHVIIVKLNINKNLKLFLNSNCHAPQIPLIRSHVNILHYCMLLLSIEHHKWSMIIQ